MPSLQPIINFIFPPLCVHCNREGRWLCTNAKQELSEHHPLVDTIDIPGVDQVILRGSYDCLSLQGVITKLKYNFWSGVYETLPEVLDPVGRQLRTDDTVIVPVPLHSRRRRERGFNQSDLIASALAKNTSLTIGHLLQRTRYTTPQATLTEAQRKTNIIDAFAVAPGVAKVPKSGILVDDVVTTGSTIAACASVLRHHGMQNITVVALAKG